MHIYRVKVICFKLLKNALFFLYSKYEANEAF